MARWLELDGSTGYGRSPLAYNPSTGDLTIEIRFRTDATPTDEILIQQEDLNGTGRSWLRINASGVLVSFVGGGEISSGVTLAANTEYLATFVYNNATGTYQWYVNGTAETSGSVTAEASDGKWLVGSGKTPPTMSFGGRLLELRFWSTVRTGTEVSDNAARNSLTGTEAGLLALYEFNQAGGTVVNDETDNNRDMDLFGTYTWTSDSAVRASQQYVEAVSYDPTAYARVTQQYVEAVSYDPTARTRVTQQYVEVLVTGESQAAVTSVPVVEIRTADIPTEVWEDITQYVKEPIVTIRGAQSELNRMEAGVASLVLDNRKQVFNPDNNNSPLFGKIRPMVPLRISFDVAGVRYPAYYGYVESWPQRYPGGNDSVVTPDCSDYFQILANMKLPDGVWEYEVGIKHPPTHWWRLGEQSGTIAYDNKTNPINGEYKGGATFNSRNGGLSNNPDNAIGFDGVSQWMKIPHVITGAGSFWWVMLFRWSDDSVSPVDLLQHFAFIDGQYRSLWKIRATNTGTIQLVEYDPVAKTTTTTNISRGVADGSWRFLAFGRDAAATNPWKLSVNGENFVSFGSTALIDYPDIGFIGVMGNGVDYSGGEVDEVILFEDEAPDQTTVNDLYPIFSAPWDGDKAGDRVDRILSLVRSYTVHDIPVGKRRLDEGNSTFGPTALGGTALEYISRIVDSEFGRVYIQRDGGIKFRERHALLKSPYNQSQMVIGDQKAASVDAHIESGPIEQTYGIEGIINRALTGRDNSDIVYEEKDNSSMTTYGERVFDRTDLLHQSDHEAKGLGEWIILLSAEPQVRLNEVVLNPLESFDAAKKILSRELEDRITVKFTPPGLEDTTIEESWTFEDDTIGSVPTGWRAVDTTAASTVEVQNHPTGTQGKAIRILDSVLAETPTPVRDFSGTPLKGKLECVLRAEQANALGSIQLLAAVQPNFELHMWSDGTFRYTSFDNNGQNAVFNTALTTPTSYVANTDYKIRIEWDFRNGNTGFDVYINDELKGVALNSNITTYFADGVHKFRFRTGGDTTGTFWVDDVYLFSSTAVAAHDFEDGTVGQHPSGWTISGETGSSTVTVQNHPNASHGKAIRVVDGVGADQPKAFLDWGKTVSRGSCEILVRAQQTTCRFSLFLGGANFAVYFWEDGTLRYRKLNADGSVNSFPQLPTATSYLANTDYRILITWDDLNGFDVYVDGVLKGQNLNSEVTVPDTPWNFSSETSGVTTGTYWLDELYVWEDEIVSTGTAPEVIRECRIQGIEHSYEVGRHRVKLWISTVADETYAIWDDADTGWDTGKWSF